MHSKNHLTEMASLSDCNPSDGFESLVSDGFPDLSLIAFMTSGTERFVSDVL